MPSSRHELLLFYLAHGLDAHGRAITEIWNFDFEALEFVHDYIQWIFPVRKPSSVNAQAPLLDDKVIEAFRTNPTLRANMLKSFDMMLDFYGLEREIAVLSRVTIVRVDEYEDRRREWQTRGNHNFLRISRILESLTLLGLKEHADAFYKCLEGIVADDPKVFDDSPRHWKEALEVA